MHRPMVDVVPTSLCFASLQLKKRHFLPRRPVVWNCHISMTTLIFLHLCYTVKLTISYHSYYYIITALAPSFLLQLYKLGRLLQCLTNHVQLTNIQVQISRTEFTGNTYTFMMPVEECDEDVDGLPPAWLLVESCPASSCPRWLMKKPGQ